MKAFLTAIAAMSLCCASLFAQDVVTFYGKVIDSATGQPVSAASVLLEGTTVTNVTNSEGVFSLKVPADNRARVVVSHLGYLTVFTASSSFAASSQDKPAEVFLPPTIYQLDPARIHALDAYSIVRDALLSVHTNYPSSHVGMMAFYRELIRKGGRKFIVLNEAVLDIDKAPYNVYVSDRASIYKGRGSVNYDHTDSLAVKFQGGIMSCFEADLAKNPFPGCDIKDLNDTYDFKLVGSNVIDGRTFYEIEFNQRPGDTYILYRGTLFIDTETLAFGRVVIRMNVEGREEEASTAFVRKKPNGYRIFINESFYEINYRLSAGKWYLDYAHLSVAFDTRAKGTLFRNHYSVDSEMAITSHKDEVMPIGRDERVRFSDILSNQVADFADDNFWGDYNVIEPDQNINQVVRRIVRQLERRR